ncbi:MAG: methyltransferase family protein [Candidatus Micrarchaeaceae archaeon]
MPHLSFYSERSVICIFACLPLQAWAFYAAMAALLFGIFMRFWSEYTLGRFFTYPVLVMSSHKLVEKRPYRYIRHPSHLGGIMIMASQGLVSRALTGTLVSLAIMLIAYSYRIYRRRPRSGGTLAGATTYTQQGRRGLYHTSHEQLALHAGIF